MYIFTYAYLPLGALFRCVGNQGNISTMCTRALYFERPVFFFFIFFASWVFPTARVTRMHFPVVYGRIKFYEKRTYELGIFALLTWRAYVLRLCGRALGISRFSFVCLLTFFFYDIFLNRREFIFITRSIIAHCFTFYYFVPPLWTTRFIALKFERWNFWSARVTPSTSVPDKSCRGSLVDFSCFSFFPLYYFDGLVFPLRVDSWLKKMEEKGHGKEKLDDGVKKEYNVSREK